MWNESNGSAICLERRLPSRPAEDMDTIASRRASAASDDSFDASSYIHVDNKLDSQMPKSLLGSEASQKPMENHFNKPKAISSDASVTKSGKRVIRKRLSMSEFNASRLKANINNNSNAASRKSRNNGTDLLNTSSSDNDTLPRTKKRSTDVLSAKIQHLLFEMKRLRQLDRDLLRQFLLINDSIEEQKWLMEEKQEAIKRSLSEEGEDPVAVNFDAAPDTPQRRPDDEGSIQSLLSRENSTADDFSEAAPAKIVEVTREVGNHCDLASTSSDSALSMTGGSSTLSSTTSLPISNRSTSPSTSNLSTTSSSYVEPVDSKTSEIITTARTESVPRRAGREIGGDDVEGYYRMTGYGARNLPRQARSFDAGARHSAYDDTTLDSAYSTRRGSTDSDSRDAADKARKNIAKRAAHFPRDDRNARPVSRSNSTRAHPETGKSSKRVSVQPDGRVAPRSKKAGGLRRASSVNEKTSTGYNRLLQSHPAQRQLARYNINRQIASLSFVPIAEQDTEATESERIYGTNYTQVERGKSERHALKTSRSFQQAPSLRDMSSSPMTSSTSDSSIGLHRVNNKYQINDTDSYSSTDSKSQDPVWVQRYPAAQIKANNHYDVSQRYRSFQSQPYMNGYHYGRGGLDFADSYYERGNCSRQASYAPAYHPNAQSNRVLPASCAPRAAPGANQAVYKWIQTQDDVTYL